MGQASVEAGLRRGNLLLKVVPGILKALFIILPLVLVILNEEQAVWAIPVGFGLAFIVSWLWWSFAVTHWRIWAYEHVRNIHELMEVAMNDKLIYPKGGWFERKEIRTPGQREVLRQLEARLATPDERADDPSVPPETAVRHSRAQMIALIVFGAAMIGISLVFILPSDSWLPLLLTIGVGAWMVADGVRKLVRNRLVLLINRDGLVLNEKQFIPWGRITRAQVVLQGSGRNSRHVLVVEHAGARTELGIGALDITKNKLRHPLKVHRHRWEHGLDAR